MSTVRCLQPRRTPRPRVGRTLLVLIIAAQGFVFHADTCRAEPARVQTRRVFVPEKHPEQWPQGDWIPIRPGRLNALLKSAGMASSKLERFSFASADYQATFNPHTRRLEAGTATLHLGYEVRGLIPFEPCRLTVLNPQWNELTGDASSGRQAVLGADISGLQRLVVPDTSRELTFNWSLSGRQRLTGIDFDVEVPKAVVTGFRLVVPAGWQVSSNAGFVRPAENGEASLPNGDGNAPAQLTSWQIDLGQLNKCRIRIYKPGDTHPLHQTEKVAYRLNSRLHLRTEFLEQSFDFTFETLPPGTEEIAVSIPPDLIVSSIEDGSGRAYSWRDTGPRPDKWHLLRVQGPGSGPHRVVIHGNLPVPQLRSEQMPLRLQLPRPADAVLLSGNLSVVIESPYQIASYSSDGLRQTETSVDEDRYELSFQQHSLRARLDLRVQNFDRLATSKLSVREYAQLDLSTSPRQMSVVIELTSQSQGAFTSFWLVPLEWELTAVTLADQSVAASSTSESLTWSVSRSPDKHQLLIIDFADGLPVREPLRLKVKGQRVDRSRVSEIQVPAILPSVARSVSVVLGVVGCEDSSQLHIDTSTYRRYSDTESLAGEEWNDLVRLVDGSPEAVWATGYWMLTEDVQSATLLLPDNTTNPDEVVSPDSNAVQSQESGESSEASSKRSSSPANGSVLPEDMKELQGTSRELDNALTSQDLQLTQPKIVSAVFSSQLSPSTVSQDLHRFTWQFHYSSEASPFRFRLPQGSELLSVIWRGQKVAPVQEGTDWYVPLAMVNAGDELSVDYTLPSQDVYLRETYRCRIPAADVTVIAFDWQVRLRSRYSVVSFSTELTADEAELPGSWLSWCFGPLARNRASSIFDPLDRNSWKRLFQGEDAETILRPGRSNRDWVAFSASATGLPDSLTVHICDHSRLNALSWFVLTLSLLVGVLLRAVAAPHRSQFALLWLSGCVASVSLVPGAYGELVGAAALGSILATLVPRSLVRPVRKRESESQKSGMASTITRRVIMGTMILLLIQAANSALAQQEESESATVIDVLIPYSTSPFQDGKEATFVLIRSTDFQSLIEASIQTRDAHPQSLLTQSRWDISVSESGRAEVVADITVALHDRNTRELEIPIPARFLAGQAACTIDGVPVGVLPTADGSRLRVPVPSDLELIQQTAASSSPPPPPVPEPIDYWREYIIRLHLRPLTNRSADLARVSLPVPAILDSRFALTFHQNPKAIFIGELSEPVLMTADETVEISPGPVDEWKVAWRPPASAETLMARSTTKQPDVEVRSSIEIHPNWMERRTLARYLVTDQAVRLIAWKLPPHCQVDLDQFRLRNLVDKAIQRVGKDKILVCEFDPPMTGPFDFDFRWRQLQPDTNQSRAVTWAVPVVPEETRVPLTIKSHLAGLSPEAGYQPSQELQNLAMTSDVDADEFIEMWGENDRPRSPQMAFRISEGTVLIPEISPLKTQRTTRLSQVARIQPFGVRWTISAEVDTAVVPAFTHEFRLDDTFRVDSVTVLEDDVDRLSHWEHRKGRLFLHLRDRRSGVQNITITGQQRIDPDGAVKVPRIESVVGVNAEPVLLVYLSRQLQVVVEGAESITEESATDDDHVNSDDFVGRFRLTRGQSTRLIIEQVPVEPSAWILASMTSDESQKLKVSATVHLHAVSSRRIQIELPDWAVQGDLEVSAAGQDKSVIAEVAPDRQTVEITLPRPLPQQVQLTLVAVLSVQNDPSFALPPPLVRNIEQQHAVVMLADGMDDQELLPDDLLSEVLQNRFAEYVPEFVANSKYYVAWTQATRVSQVSTISESEYLAPFVLHQLRPGIRRNGVSTTRIILHSDQSHVSLKWPPGAELISVQIDGQIESVLPPVDGVLRLPFPEQTTVHDLEILWRLQPELTAMKIQRRLIPVPQLDEVTGPGNTFVIAAPSRRVNLMAIANRADQDFRDAEKLAGQWISFVRQNHGAKARLDAVRQIKETLNSAVTNARATDSSPVANSTGSAVDSVRRSATESLIAIAGNGWRASESEIIVERVDGSNIAFWIVDSRINRLLGSILIAIIVLPLFVLFLGLETGDRIARYPEVCWLLLGVIWWLCLKGSGAGFVLGVTSALWIAASYLLARRAESRSKAAMPSASQ